MNVRARPLSTSESGGDDDDPVAAAAQSFYEKDVERKAREVIRHFKRRLYDFEVSSPEEYESMRKAAWDEAVDPWSLEARKVIEQQELEITRQVATSDVEPKWRTIMTRLRRDLRREMAHYEVTDEECDEYIERYDLNNPDVLEKIMEAVSGTEINGEWMLREHTGWLDPRYDMNQHVLDMPVDPEVFKKETEGDLTHPFHEDFPVHELRDVDVRYTNEYHDWQDFVLDPEGGPRVEPSELELKFAEKLLDAYPDRSSTIKSQDAEGRRKLAAHDIDTGSYAAQIGQLSAKIERLEAHTAINRKDYSAVRGLDKLLHRRRKHLVYLKRSRPKEFERVLELAPQLQGVAEQRF